MPDARCYPALSIHTSAVDVLKWLSLVSSTVFFLSLALMPITTMLLLLCPWPTATSGFSLNFIADSTQFPTFHHRLSRTNIHVPCKSRVAQASAPCAGFEFPSPVRLRLINQWAKPALARTQRERERERERQREREIIIIMFGTRPSYGSKLCELGLDRVDLPLVHSLAHWSMLVKD
ncbi:hypothetical protein GGR50DRAFT_652380 [Xylaria sp. CBS 124048]|nr:hypothetical protein GGR50DRAFT_652380 [Xylaria sp. CBS 124048]